MNKKQREKLQQKRFIERVEMLEIMFRDLLVAEMNNEYKQRKLAKKLSRKRLRRGLKYIS